MFRRYDPIKHRTGMLVFLLALTLLVMSSVSPYFLQASTVPYLLQYIPILGLLGLGQTLIMLAGGPGIDLSVGSMLSLSAVLIGFLVGGLGLNVYVAALLGIAFGGLLGILNGIAVNVLRIPSLMATLATLFVYGGLALALTGGVPLTGFPESFAWLGQETTLGLPNQFLFVFVPVTVVLHVVLTQTRIGRHIYAAGNDESAAHLLGVAVGRLRTYLYGLSGVLAGLGAVINVSWFLAARPDAGKGLDLLSVTIAVLGGTHIFGGLGGIPGTVVAIFIVTALQVGLQLANISAAWQLGVIGLLLIGSIAINRVFAARGARPT